MVKINLNEKIKVKLTDYGKVVYYNRLKELNDKLGSMFKPCFPKEDEEGYATFQLWVFMETYGQYMNMTTPNVIKPLEIIYQEEENV